MCPYFLGTYKQPDRKYLNDLVRDIKRGNMSGSTKLYAEVAYQTTPAYDDSLYEYISGILLGSIADQAIDMALHPNKGYPRGEDNNACYLYNAKELENFMKYFKQNNGDLNNLKCFIIYDTDNRFFCYEISLKRHYQMYTKRFFSYYCIKNYNYKVIEICSNGNLGQVKAKYNKEPSSEERAYVDKWYKDKFINKKLNDEEEE